MKLDYTTTPKPPSEREPAAKSAAASGAPPAPVAAAPRFPIWLPAVLLALATLALYWPALHHDFVNYDDDAYVTDNVHVQSGLTLASVSWAFGHPVTGNWHPLTMMSHMLDCQLYGLKPWGHHLTSVLLHALNTSLVFLLLRRLTGAVWRSALVAAMFGWSAVNVESVAWVAERKSVLSAFFGLLTLLFYARYAQAQIAARARESEIHSSLVTHHSSHFYWLSLCCFALGLMSKSLLVTWPFVMLLLDYWPLERFQSGRVWSLLREKIPFFALVAVVCGATMLTHEQMGDVQQVPLGAHVANVLVSYCRYLGKLFWPSDLVVFYPFTRNLPLAGTLLAAALLAGLSTFFWTQRRRYPCLLMGWLWYLATLVPVIGLVQVGYQSMADRHAYLPSLGAFIIVVWGAHELTRRWPAMLGPMSVAGVLALLLCLGLTRHQLTYWQDDETLFRRALAVTRDNYLARNNLSLDLSQQGRTEAAIGELQEAIRIKPDYATAYDNLGVDYVTVGRTNEAVNMYHEALRLQPDFAKAHDNLAIALVGNGQLDEAVREFQAASACKPDYAAAHKHLAFVYLNHGRMADAVQEYRILTQLTPADASAHCNLGVALANEGHADDATGEFQEAIRLKSDFAEAHKDLGVMLVKSGRLDEAISQLQEALRLKPDFTSAQTTLAKVLALENRGQPEKSEPVKP